METQKKLLIDRILNTFAEQKATDLHMTVGIPPVLRIDEKLIPLDNEPIIDQELLQSFVGEILDEGQLKTLEEKREIVIAYQFNKQARFRVNIYYQKRALAAYLRIIGTQIVPLNQLGLPLGALEKISDLQEGLVLVSGAFGSGKTTTSASIIDHINTLRSAYILSIEKPIEYIFTNKKSIVEQREVGRDALNFEKALSLITQEDVDVVFVSELSSPEIIKQALNVATSGRLVIANIEADTIIKTLEFLINHFPSNEQLQIRHQLSINLEGIICQQLVPNIGGGQVAIAEIMISTPPIRSLIKEGSLNQISNIIQTSREEGMVPLDWSLAELVKTNTILLDQALKHASDPTHLKHLLRV
ncbi:PilT/PilU family type 4a pilus ATPase [Patescibacteria group bacterium]|nr:PilT/PilU family type 4a pilus ATPase [Patescibacteria group bacterium]MBU0964449.1 PilT/PilU family type 4a pilus ATPase [Patescibacteria group bacterium]